MADPGGPIIEFEEGWDNQIKPKALDRLERCLNVDGLGNAAKEKSQGAKLFDSKEYIDVYTTCYNMCTQRAPYNWSERLYTNHASTMSNYLATCALPALQAKHDVFLLHELYRRWIDHKVMNKWMQKFFMYLDRFYVKYHQVPTLEEAGFRYFKTTLFDVIKKDVSNTLVMLINKERGGDQLDHGLIRSIIEIFEAMGMGSLETYIKDFELQLVDTSREYFARISVNWMSGCSLPEYLRCAETLLNDERRRISAYLHPSSELKILQQFDDEILTKRELELLEKDGVGLKQLLTMNSNDDIARMFRLFSRLDTGQLNGLSPMVSIFQAHVVACGTEILDSRATVDGGNGKAAEGGGGGGKAVALERVGSEDPKTSAPALAPNVDKSADENQLVINLIALHDKYSSLVAKEFSSHSLFQKGMKDAFCSIMNREIGKSRMADLLSNYADKLLKSGSAGESYEQIDLKLEQIVQLFVYLSDKDHFADAYRTLLARRLLNQRASTDDLERSIISKLKLRCGAQFTAKLEGMISDLSIGADLNERFKSQPAANSIDFSVQVLTTGYWPSFKIFDEVTLPPQMTDCTQSFTQFYASNTTHRQLKWLISLGSVNVKMVAKYTYTLQLNTLQAIVISRFAHVTAETAIPFETLATELKLPRDILKSVLHSLSCGLFVILKKVGATEKKIIVDSDSFSVNWEFQNRNKTFRVPMANLEDSLANKRSEEKRLEDDRTIVIEASIVRIMKARKTLQHQQLVGEVLHQLTFFKPDTASIKRRIEALIEREYLERDGSDPNIYKYLA